MNEATRRAALAVHSRARRAALDSFRGVELGTVRRLDPLAVELHESSITLGYADLQLSVFVRWWDLNFGILAGDVLALGETAGHVWVALAVLTNRDVAAGPRPLKPPAQQGKGNAHPELDASSEATLFTLGAVPAGGGTPSVTWNHHVVRKMEVYDSAGNRLGWVPVFGTLP